MWHQCKLHAIFQTLGMKISLDMSKIYLLTNFSIDYISKLCFRNIRQNEIYYCFFSFLTYLNVAMRTFKVIYVVWITFLLDNTALKAECYFKAWFMSSSKTLSEESVAWLSLALYREMLTSNILENWNFIHLPSWQTLLNKQICCFETWKGMVNNVSKFSFFADILNPC